MHNCLKFNIYNLFEILLLTFGVIVFFDVNIICG